MATRAASAKDWCLLAFFALLAVFSLGSLVFLWVVHSEERRRCETGP
jgi:hypothetical protein